MEQTENALLALASEIENGRIKSASLATNGKNIVVEITNQEDCTSFAVTNEVEPNYMRLAVEAALERLHVHTKDAKDSIGKVLSGLGKDMIKLYLQSWWHSKTQDSPNYFRAVF